MIIALDLDEVIAEFHNGFIKFHNYSYKTNVSIEDFPDYYLFTGSLNITREQAIDRVYEFYESEFFDQIKPFPGAIVAVNKLKENHKLYIITSRQNDLKPKTKKWLDKHLPNTFEDVIHTNSFSPDGSKQLKKSEVCDQIKAEVFIDDRIEYIEECLKHGRKTILFEAVWNKNKATPKGALKVKGWEEALDPVS